MEFVKPPREGKKSCDNANLNYQNGIRCSETNDLTREYALRSSYCVHGHYLSPCLSCKENVSSAYFEYSTLIGYLIESFRPVTMRFAVIWVLALALMPSVIDSIGNADTPEGYITVDANGTYTFFPPDQVPVNEEDEVVEGVDGDGVAILGSHLDMSLFLARKPSIEGDKKCGFRLFSTNRRRERCGGVRRKLRGARGAKRVQHQA